MLEKLFSPRSVAVVGASRSEGKLGHTVLKNLIDSGYPGTIYPVNPKANEILGLTTYPSVEIIEGILDLAVIVTPAKLVLDVLEQCGRKGAGAAIVISAGFRETGLEGLKAERKIGEIARAYHMDVIGPNCLGIINTLTPMNASFAADMPKRGPIAFMSQSGALCTSILDMSFEKGVGFSKFVSLGNKAHLGEIDFIRAWEDDPQVNVILGYIEGITDGSRFMEAARKVTKKKPIVAIKSGTTSAGAKAVSSHTGTLAGTEQAYEAAFRQSGVIRAVSMDHMFYIAQTLAHQPLPTNNRIAIVTNAGGPGIMATDAIERAGLSLASLAPDTMEELRKSLPPAASIINPVDVLGDALADRYSAALSCVAKDPAAGTVLVILTPQIMTQVEETARAVIQNAKTSSKPILTCFMGEKRVRKGIRMLEEKGIPNYPTPETAVAAIKAMVQQREWMMRPNEKPVTFEADQAACQQVFSRARSEGLLEIGETEAQSILRAYGISQPRSKLCATPEEATAFADECGYPVVLKIASPDILHKTDIGGVRLNLSGPDEVADAFELMIYRASRYMPEARIWGCMVQKQVRGGKEVIIGMNRDPQFGPLVMFGLGGIYVEIIKDVSCRIAPFARQDAQEMISELKSASLLYGVRGEARSDLEAIVDTLLRVSQMVVDLPEILEMDINPLVVFQEGKGVVGLDARFVLSA